MSSSAAAARRIKESLRPAGDWSTRRAKIVDTLLILALAPMFVLAVVGAHWGQAANARVVTEAAAAVLVLVGIVLLARPYPLPALAASFPGLVWLDTFSLLTTVTAYLAGRRRPNSRPAFLLVGLLAAGGALLVVLQDPDDATRWFTAVMLITFNLLFPWVIGMYQRQRAQLVTAGWELAEHLEREQRIVAEQTRMRERSRIAQDMHDSLGHELSLIALRAGALEVVPGADEDVRQAARELRENAAAATDRLREIIGVLRDDTEPAPVRPTDEDVSLLVERARASGMEVTLVRRGGPGPHLSAMTDRAVYRTVQEALTNANKHAPGAEVAVFLEYTPERVEVRVDNGPSPSGSAAGQVGGGRGLIGLRERVRLAGGVLRTGEHGGGWRVAARLPVRAEDADGTAEPPDAQAEGHSRTTRYYHQVRRRMRWGLVAFLALPCAGCVVLAVIVALDSW